MVTTCELLAWPGGRNYRAPTSDRRFRWKCVPLCSRLGWGQRAATQHNGRAPHSHTQCLPRRPDKLGAQNNKGNLVRFAPTTGSLASWTGPAAGAARRRTQFWLSLFGWSRVKWRRCSQVAGSPPASVRSSQLAVIGQFWFPCLFVRVFVRVCKSVWSGS